MHYVEVKGILSANNGMNLYRGCSHGCIYCDTRSKCYQFTHDFEDIEVKQNAPELLEKALMSKRKKCMIGTGSMCDPYLHIEENIKLTRRCLEIINNYGFGVSIITKSNRILRDLDLIESINNNSKAVVQMTLTTYDEKLCKLLEPNVSTTRERFEALKMFRDRNIKAIVWLDPILPFINDTEENLRGILSYCVEAKVYGIIFFGFGLTLREGNREYFYEQLDKKFPGMKEKYIKNFGNSYEVNSPNSKRLYKILKEECEKNNIILNNELLFAYLHEYPQKYEQITLFD